MYFLMTDAPVKFKNSKVDLEIIGNTFSKYPLTKKVVVFAEAIRYERYELLDILKKYIQTDDETMFYKAVDLWLDKNVK